LIEGTTIRGCSAAFGGALNFGDGNLIIRDSRFEGCRADGFGGGGAIMVQSDDMTYGYEARVERCVFEGNRAGDAGAFGFGSQRGYALFEFRDCVFRDNETLQSGGALALAVPGPAMARIEGCLFDGNRSGIGNPPGSFGGAAYLFGGHAELTGNTFYNCQTEPNGGGSALVAQNALSTVFSNNVVASCPSAAAVLSLSVFQFTSTCNVFWDNPGGNAEGFALSATDRVVDPLFCDVSSHDFTVRQDSPCLPENSLGCGLIGAFDVGCGVISVDPTSWGKVKTYFRAPKGE
jgi:hypothetical protein